MIPFFITHIEQKDNFTFTLRWSDGLSQDFRLSDLQKNCPCARCIDETTGERRIDPQTVDENVRAVVIQNVGRYGLKIQFTSGCSLGIYSFERLRNV